MSLKNGLVSFLSQTLATSAQRDQPEQMPHAPHLSNRARPSSPASRRTRRTRADTPRLRTPRSYKDALEWRKYVESKLPADIVAFSALHGKIYIAKEHLFKNTYPARLLSTPQRDNHQRCDVYAAEQSTRGRWSGPVSRASLPHMDPSESFLIS
jgi:hypothetical protein